MVNNLIMIHGCQHNLAHYPPLLPKHIRPHPNTGLQVPDITTRSYNLYYVNLSHGCGREEGRG
jgi:hypothetical protein